MSSSAYVDPLRSFSLVLVVEDDAQLAATIGETVEDLGYRALCVENGREALSVLASEQPRVMLVDLFMPVMNGTELLKEVKRSPRLSGIPRVIMTGTNDPTIGIREDTTVLYKPVDFDALTQLVHKYCRQ
jgi:CheY-like chemotaxis protein